MNIEEGGRRLVAVISWIVGLGFCFASVISLKHMNIGWWIIVATSGIFVGLICSRIGLWIVNGFVGDQENNEY